MKKQIFILTLFSVIFFVACEKEGSENETKISRNFLSESHNAGENCMDCHISNGGGEGWFTVAGTIYENSSGNTYPNAVVKLTSQSQGGGEVVKNIEVDNKGNFYTTEAVSFGEGLYVTVISTDGKETYMGPKITHGRCNECHGNSIGKIGIN